MTVNELIAELQVLSAQGHGEFAVFNRESDGGIAPLKAVNLAKDESNNSLRFVYISAKP